MQINQRKNLVLIGILGIFILGSLIACNTTTASLPEQATQTTEYETSSEETLTGSVRGRVLTDSGDMVAAGIIVEDQNGNLYRTTTNPESGYNLLLMPGDYTLYFTRGIEYSIVTKQISVERSKKYYLQDVRLVKMFDSYSQGWIAADLHQHSYYSDGADSVAYVLLSDITNGLYAGFLTDHNSAYGLAEWVQGDRLVANIDESGNDRMFNALEGVEVTTEFGHFQSLGTGLTFDTYEVALRELERAQEQEEKDQYFIDRISYIADMIKRNGGVAQINHPYSASTMGFNYWELADLFDTIEIWNGYFVPGDGRYIGETIGSAQQNYSAKLKWFDLLNQIKNGGKFLAATGGSDNHDSSSPYIRNSMLAGYNITNIGDFPITNMDEYQAVHELRGRYNGNPATFLHIQGDINLESILDAIRKGHSFITNGPIVIADVDGKTYGETVSLNGSNTVRLNIQAYSRDGINSINIVKNGETVLSIDDITRPNYEGGVDLQNINSGDWIILEGMGVATEYCITNPIFFQ